MINCLAEARHSLEMMDCSLEHIYKAVCPDKKSNPFSILQTVSTTYSSNAGTDFFSWFSVVVVVVLWKLKCHVTSHWRLLKRWFKLDSF